MPTPRSFEMLGASRLDVLVSAEESRGATSVITESCGPGGGPPPHVHTREDEFLMPLDGGFEVFDGAAWAPCPAEGVFTPRRHVHTWRKTDDGPGRILIVTTPGGIEEMFHRLKDLRLPKDLDEMVRISREYGISYVDG